MLGDLNAVERRPLAYIVTHHPQIEPARMRDVFAYAPHEHGIMLCGLSHCGGITAVLVLIN